MPGTIYVLIEDVGIMYGIRHRSGGTGYSFIADPAVATNACRIKTGLARGADRIANSSGGFRIEKEVKSQACPSGTRLYL
jgi:enolase